MPNLPDRLLRMRDGAYELGDRAIHAVLDEAPRIADKTFNYLKEIAGQGIDLVLHHTVSQVRDNEIHEQKREHHD